VDVVFNGTTRGFVTEVPNPFPPPPTIPTDEGGIVEWGGPFQVLVGDYLLEFEAMGTEYNSPLSIVGDGEAEGANVPVKITLIDIVPEPTSIALLAAGGVMLLARRRRAA
jgi:hypothetical protein